MISLCYKNAMDNKLYNHTSVFPNAKDYTSLLCFSVRSRKTEFHCNRDVQVDMYYIIIIAINAIIETHVQT